MKKILTGPIRFYQKHISPQTPPSCRYHPTCSTYALEAIEKHGAIKGGIMGTARIIRCNPFVEGGVDEVPDYFTIFRNPDNINDRYIPEYLMPVDREAQEKVTTLLETYEDQLKISEQLPSSLATLQNIADVKELTIDGIKAEFSEEELDFLEDIEIFPNLTSEEYKHFTLPKTERNKPYLKEVEDFDPEVDLGSEYPIVVLEKTGIWYSNMPRLAQEFLVARGVTPADLENRSYHLWLVLNAMDKLQTGEESET